MRETSEATARLKAGLDIEDLPSDPAEAFLEFESQLRSTAIVVLRKWKSDREADVRVANSPMRHAETRAGTGPDRNAAKHRLRKFEFFEWDIWQAYYDLLSVFTGEFRFRMTVDHPNLHNLPNDPEEIQRLPERIEKMLSQVDGNRFGAELGIVRAGKTTIKEVVLSQSVKKQLRELTERIRQKIEEAEIPRRKKESLFASLSRFESELDHDKTKLERIAEISLDLADTGTEVAKRLSGARKVMKLVEKVLGQAKENEGIKRLGHEEMFKIEDKSGMIEDDDDD